MSNENSEIKNKPKIYNRKSLYEYFKNGSRPLESHFHDLINSTINKLDDGISKDFDNGLQLAPQKSNGTKGNKLISLYEQLDGSNPLWTINLIGTEDNKKLSIESEKGDKILLVLTPDGRIGINNAEPLYDLDVNGHVGMKARIGTYNQQEFIKANNQWYPILKGLNGCTMFEITAVAYDKQGQGKYASLHAIVSNAYSGRRGRIHCTRDYYGWKWWRRIGLRWSGNPFNYQLEMKTHSDYGSEGTIEYNISQLGKHVSYD